MEMINCDKIMTTEEVCSYLRLCRNTVMSLVKNGKLNYAKLGKEYRFRQSDIQLLFEKEFNKQ